MTYLDIKRPSDVVCQPPSATHPFTALSHISVHDNRPTHVHSSVHAELPRCHNLKNKKTKKNKKHLPFVPAMRFSPELFAFHDRDFSKYLAILGHQFTPLEKDQKSRARAVARRQYHPTRVPTQPKAEGGNHHATWHGS